MRSRHRRLLSPLMPIVAGLFVLGPVVAPGALAGGASAAGSTTGTSAQPLAWHSAPVQAPSGGTGPVSNGEPLSLLSTGNMTCLSRTDCVVAGFLQDQEVNPQTYKAVIWQWDGKQWSAPATGVSGNAALVGTACPSATDCWAVGGLVRGAQLNQLTGLADHYNGKNWSPSTLPAPDGVALNGVSCAAASDCLAVGNLQTSSDTAHATAYRWDGKTWSASPAPSPAGAMWTILDSVVCFTATDCLVVGDARNSVNGPAYFFGEHFNGTSWSLSTMPNPAKFNMGNATFLSLYCPAPSRCLALGSGWGYTDGREGLNTLSGVGYSWDGKSWAAKNWPSSTCFGQCRSQASAGALAYQAFYYPDEGSCTTPKDCWVGVSLNDDVVEGYPGHGPLENAIAIAHWDGTAFRLSQASPKGFIYAVGCLPVTAGTWCVGIGEAPSDWVGKGTARQPSKVVMTGGYFVAGT